MKYIRDTSEEVMVREFLRAELKSSRFAKNLIPAFEFWGIPKEVITQGNCTDANENFIRRWLLAQCRGYYQNTQLFRGFPEGTVWKVVMLEKADINLLMYGNHEEWIEISNKSRLVVEGAREIKRRLDNKFISEITGFLWGLRNERELPCIPPPIVVSHDYSYSKLVLLEGHTRATAYALAETDEMQVIVGIHPDMNKWVWY